MSQNNVLVRIQKGVDLLISKNGSEYTAELIEAIAIQTNSNNHNYFNAIADLIILNVVKTFNINYKLLSSGASENYKDARKCCFYLLNKHCKMSEVKIKKFIPNYTKTTGAINASIKNMKSIMELPRINKELEKKCIQIENKILEFKTINK